MTIRSIARLKVGLENSTGERITELTIREATINDTINAVSKAPLGANNLLLRMYKAVEQIEPIDDLKTPITIDTLLSLSDLDLEPIMEAQDEIEKKLLGSK